MSAYTPSHVFASVTNKQNTPYNLQNTVPTGDANRENLFSKMNIGMKNSENSDRFIKVTAVGEVSLPPDRCRISIKVHSQKDNVQDVKNSVQRRQDYIIQSLQNHGVKDTDMKIYKTLRRLDGMFDYVTETVVVFLDFNKCQTVCNLLVEKLDDTVTVGNPEYYHAGTTLETLRQQASLLAIHNAKQKAHEMASFVHQVVSKPICIEEEESKEWEGQIEGVSDLDTRPTPQQLIAQATVTVSCRVNITFELKRKVKTKTHKE